MFLVTGGNRLSGEIIVGGAKNSVLKLMAISLLAEGMSTISNCPAVSDVLLMVEVLREVGATVELNGETVHIVPPDNLKYVVNFSTVKQFRASICILGPLIAKCKKVKVALPGGDEIGYRPLDIHQYGLSKLGIRCSIENSCLVAEADKLQAAEIYLKFPSVGATESILMTAVLIKGVTTIYNAAREPDIVDICTMLSQMGANIIGAGTSKLIIKGVDKLYPTKHYAIGDRIVAATWGIAAAITCGDISVTGINPSYLSFLLDKLHSVGASVTWNDKSFRVVQYERPKAFNTATLPFPGFPTDLQPMAIVLASIAKGMSLITENIFESRFKFVKEINLLGANTQTYGQHALLLRGIPQLFSATVSSSDIRAGASLVLASLVAHGETKIHNVFHIDRGYPLFVENLLSLGAKIKRIKY